MESCGVTVFWESRTILHSHVTSFMWHPKALIQRILKVELNQLIQVIQGDPCMTKYNTANNNIIVMHHSTDSRCQVACPIMEK